MIKGVKGESLLYFGFSGTADWYNINVIHLFELLERTYYAQLSRE